MRHTMVGNMMNAPELEVAKPGELDEFWRRVDRDWRSELWNFRVVWHEQTQDRKSVV